MRYNNLEVFKAKFISEGKTRFVCNIEYQNVVIECYVPNTCKLSKLITLNKNEVLITKNLNKTKRTRFTLFAIKIDNKYLIVNTALTNKLVYHYITNNNEYCLLPEKTIEQYKCDFYISDKKTLVEAKSIISNEEALLIPNSFSNRAIEQLEKLYNIIQKDYLVEYYFVIFNNKLKSIKINKSTKYGKLLLNNQACGMKLTFLQGIYNEKDNSIEVVINNDIVIE